MIETERLDVATANPDWHGVSVDLKRVDAVIVAGQRYEVAIDSDPDCDNVFVGPASIAKGDDEGGERWVNGGPWSVAVSFYDRQTRELIVVPLSAVQAFITSRQAMLR